MPRAEVHEEHDCMCLDSGHLCIFRLFLQIILCLIHKLVAKVRNGFLRCSVATVALVKQVTRHGTDDVHHRRRAVVVRVRSEALHETIFVKEHMDRVEST